MQISFNDLRQLKHALPTGSVRRIAGETGLTDQEVRNYFGAADFTGSGNHRQPGPNGGIVYLEDTRILDTAKRILREARFRKRT